MSNSNPIGFFDSGVGGTSIWKEVIQLLPQENSIYLADSKNAPYGEKSKEEIIELSRKNTEKLLNMGCKLIVVACNTATTNAIKWLRSHYDIPFIGIEPAIKPAALQSKAKSIGILATKGTLSSELFAKTSGLYSKDIKIIEVVGHGLVKLIEEGNLESIEMNNLLLDLTEPFIAEKIDCLVLGCSHYPYLLPQLKRILPKEVAIIDSGEAVARQTRSILRELNLLNEYNEFPEHKLYSNKDADVLRNLALISNLNAEIFEVDF